MTAIDAQPHPFWAHLRQTVLGEGVALALSLLVLPLAARRLDPIGFSRYVVAYRALALLQPTAMLGLGVGLTRALASGPKRDSPGLIVGALAPIGGSIALAAGVVLLFPAQIGRLVFGNGPTKSVVLGLVVLLFGSCVYTVVSSALRGLFAMAAANVLYPIYLGVVPLAALALTNRVALALAIIGTAWSVVSLAFVVRYAPGRPRDVARHAGSLLRYGLPRVPGEVALFGLLSIPSIVAVRTDGVVAGGRVALAMSLVTMGGTLCTPLASALLPHASKAMTDQGELRELGVLVRTLVARLLPALVALSALAAAVAPTALRIGLGAEYEAAATSIRLACVAVPGYGLYISLRSVLDAAFHRPITMRYAVYGFVAFLVAYGAARGLDQTESVMIAFIVGIWALAGLVAWRTHQFLERSA